jgi:hypothetical protein
MNPAQSSFLEKKRTFESRQINHFQKFKTMPQLKVGDKITERNGNSIMRICEVIRVTKTTAIIPSTGVGERKLKIDYNMVNGGVSEIAPEKYSQTSYALAQPGDPEKIRAQNAKGTLANMGNSWYSVADEKVNRILEILKEGK